MQPIAREARDVALERIRSFLRRSDTSDFPPGDKGADEFADSVVEEIKTAYQGSFTSPRAETIVRRTTKDVYTFYRLRDKSVFGSGSGPRLKFGGGDTRAVKFFDELDNFYYSGLVDNRDKGLRTIIRDEYIAKGRQLFGRGVTGEELDEFRRAVGGKLDKINDHGVRTIIESSVQRIRSYAHIKSLQQGLFKWGRIVPKMDERTSPICIHLGQPPPKYIRIGVAAATVDRLTKLEPGDYALEMYKSEPGKAYSSDPLAYIKDRIGANGVIADSAVKEGRGFPPYHPKCRTRVEAVDRLFGDVEPDEN